MKLENEPRVKDGPTFFGSLIDFLRRVARTVNGHDSDITAMKQQIADLEARVADLETP